MDKLQLVNLPIIKARFPAKCAYTGLTIKVGEMMFYNHHTKTCIKAVKVMYSDVIEHHLKTDAWLFKVVEQCFNNWIDGCNPASEMEEKYFSDEAIYDKKGAIIGAIELMFEEMKEANVRWGWLHLFEYECAFQD